ncbi:hypothetical protein COX24_01545 [bacterium (Candidatus Gribaldobacteria) CG23_combo_of_CG06-09_8_20_14_all_37_87_8]|uniref:Transglycosylase SLT domain-containing protein n=2 Tax=Candidatus Gribaldobacteria TaxID=2798536 RepID=A0A2G9ZF60_9BACT|nr:MAG: hypothetical protein AUJ25_02530 [Parcubacteria group bacterium CG1_02_37_13]PIP31797.1 MAG: hypothetical protein COX24_01545 [bacterium (Candidatus Gribaldobacteria) CG23_combo_of_CG06-09_8_20_14_all_37_87_8]PIR90677.1 MAG: hypothetical protein COU05_00685 [bacterium (Candidatus Gribaldobacteria) CG10_big_fil_rev_8_21_14_0_10_37_21]
MLKKGLKTRFFHLLKTTLFLGVCFYLIFFGQKNVFSENLEQDCIWENIVQAEKNLSKDAYKDLLESCKIFYDQKSVDLAKDITKTQAEKNTLANKIATLQKQIKNLEYQINQSNVMIKDLGGQIEDTAESIDKTISQIDEIKQQLKTNLQLKYEEDQKSTIEILFSEKTLSGFFDNLVALEAIGVKIQDLLKNVQGLKINLEGQKDQMDSEKKELEQLVTIQQLQKNQNTKQQQQNQEFLSLTEAEYKNYLAQHEDAVDKSSKIGSLLFELIEVPEGGIQFEDAVQIAKNISSQTGIRAAFSLAILWQETRIGKIQGGCYLKITSTGEGVYIKTGNKAPKSMHPTRDVPVFLQLISDLNKNNLLKTDAFNTPVSCCMISNGSYFGWGGAMGPAQFIPSTWNIYADEIATISGATLANPWNIRDAFLANALYLRDLGATKQTYVAEMNAALRYFGCASAWCQTNYGNPVMNVSKCFQEYISSGAMSVACREAVF